MAGLSDLLSLKAKEKKPVGRPKGSTKQASTQDGEFKINLAKTKEQVLKHGRPYGPSNTTGESVYQEKLDILGEEMQELVSKTTKGWHLKDIKQNKESTKQYHKRYIAHKFVSLQSNLSEIYQKMEMLQHLFNDTKRELLTCYKVWENLSTPEHMPKELQVYLAHLLNQGANAKAHK